MKELNKTPESICQWCGQPYNIIWVHGHGQCSVCGYNIEECCKGETCEQPIDQNLAEEVE
jgi:hypothetical protein